VRGSTTISSVPSARNGSQSTEVTNATVPVTDWLTEGSPFVTPTRHPRHVRSDSHNKHALVSASIAAAVGARRDAAIALEQRGSLQQLAQLRRRVVYIDSCSFRHGAENTISCPYDHLVRVHAAARRGWQR
jgi:hypothetical protein